MTDVQASYVPVEHVIGVWPKIRGFIANATAHTSGRYEPEDVLELLLYQNHQLWVAIDDSDVVGCIVTNIVDYPRKRVLSCPFVTGTEFSGWKRPMLELLGQWATDNKCEVLESTGRVGWSKVFKDDGYTAMWQSFELPIVGAGVDHG